MGPLMGVPLLPLGGGVHEKPMIVLDALGVVHGTRREVVAAAKVRRREEVDEDQEEDVALL